MALKRKRGGAAKTDILLIPFSRVDRQASKVLVEHLNGSKIVRESFLVDATIPVNRAPRDFDGIENLIGNAADIEDIQNSQEVVDHYIQGPNRQKKKKPERDTKKFASTVHDQVLTDWIEKNQREVFLDELLRLEGWRGAVDRTCPDCPRGRGTAASVRCDDCWSGTAVCVDCAVRQHAQHPLHRVKRWNGNFFEATTLQDLGLVVQLGHPPHEVCPNPIPTPRTFLIIHTNGFHPVTLAFCHCNHAHRAGNKYQQLLRMELFPSTIFDPSTCCTFRALEQFHMLTLQSKVSAYDYYKTLEKLTDNTAIKRHWDRTRPWLRMVRQWRHLKMLKRAGRGHYPDGIRTTSKGELCVKCPACADPAVNLPNNWETMADDIKFIYMTVLAIDANFRLKRRAVSNEARDPALGSGLGYFVEDKAYREFLKEHVNQDEMSTCTGFAALLSANTKFTRGYATSGVAMAIDARHGFIVPNGVGDLQKGERYCNVDYICGSAWQLLPQAVQRVISYDIACQWSVNFASRIPNLPDNVRFELPDGPGELRYAIPKWHWRAHKEEKHEQFSLYLLPGVGRVDGEEIERNWARHNMVAYSTREMGPGSRHDTLEDHFGFSNWQKMVTLGPIIKRRFKDASVEKVAQDRIYDDFQQQLRDDNMRSWITQVVAWERDMSIQPSPYYIPPHGVSEDDVRAQLAEEDMEDMDASDDDHDNNEGNAGVHDVTASSMIIALFDMEETQRKFRERYPRTSDNRPLMTAEAIEKRRGLRRRITTLRVTQAAYMPIVPQLTCQLLGRNDLPEEEKLFFPSQLSGDQLDGCTPGVAEIEERLRDGQLHDALNKLRVHLHMKSRLILFKNRNVRNQAANTRAGTKISANEAKINLWAAKYCRAREAKLVIAGHGQWENIWRVLKDGDIRTLKGDMDYAPVPTGDCNTRLPADDFRPAESEGRRKPSWIWVAADNAIGDDMGMSDAVRVEFLKARARCHRFAEEIRIIQDEQRRILVSLEKEALKWDSRVLAAHEPDLATREGKAAYAAEHAALFRGLAHKFGAHWNTPITDLALYTMDEGDEHEQEVLEPAAVDDAVEEEPPPSDVDSDPDASDIDSLDLRSDDDDE